MGPCFIGTLGIYGDIMNAKDKGCSTGNDDHYPVRPDEQGNCPLTGVKDNGKKNKWNDFTVEELEVFAVKVAE